jgi:subtilisin family serine protease
MKVTTILSRMKLGEWIQWYYVLRSAILKPATLFVSFCSYPAYYEECVSIAAVSKKEGFPVAVFSNSNAQVDYAGIGVDVVSFKPGGGFQTMSGTSMASPHACGLMACLLQKHQGKADLRTILDESHVIDIATEGVDKATGTGFLTYLDEGEFDQVMPRRK